MKLVSFTWLLLPALAASAAINTAPWSTDPAPMMSAIPSRPSWPIFCYNDAGQLCTAQDYNHEWTCGPSYGHGWEAPCSYNPLHELHCWNSAGEVCTGENGKWVCDLNYDESPGSWYLLPCKFDDPDSKQLARRNSDAVVKEPACYNRDGQLCSKQLGKWVCEDRHLNDHRSHPRCNREAFHFDQLARRESDAIVEEPSCYNRANQLCTRQKGKWTCDDQCQKTQFKWYPPCVFDVLDTSRSTRNDVEAMVHEEPAADGPKTEFVNVKTSDNTRSSENLHHTCVNSEGELCWRDELKDWRWLCLPQSHQGQTEVPHCPAEADPQTTWSCVNSAGSPCKHNGTSWVCHGRMHDQIFRDLPKCPLEGNHPWESDRREIPTSTENIPSRTVVALSPENALADALQIESAADIALFPSRRCVDRSGKVCHEIRAGWWCQRVPPYDPEINGLGICPSDVPDGGGYPGQHHGRPGTNPEDIPHDDWVKARSTEAPKAPRTPSYKECLNSRGELCDIRNGMTWVCGPNKQNRKLAHCPDSADNEWTFVARDDCPLPEIGVPVWLQGRPENFPTDLCITVDQICERRWTPAAESRDCHDKELLRSQIPDIDGYPACPQLPSITGRDVAEKDASAALPPYFNVAWPPPGVEGRCMNMKKLLCGEEFSSGDWFCWPDKQPGKHQYPGCPPAGQPIKKLAVPIGSAIIDDFEKGYPPNDPTGCRRGDRADSASAEVTKERECDPTHQDECRRAEEEPKPSQKVEEEKDCEPKNPTEYQPESKEDVPMVKVLEERECDPTHQDECRRSEDEPKASEEAEERDCEPKNATECQKRAADKVEKAEEVNEGDCMPGVCHHPGIDEVETIQDVKVRDCLPGICQDPGSHEVEPVEDVKDRDCEPKNATECQKRAEDDVETVRDAEERDCEPKNATECQKRAETDLETNSSAPALQSRSNNAEEPDLSKTWCTLDDKHVCTLEGTVCRPRPENTGRLTPCSTEWGTEPSAAILKTRSTSNTLEDPPNNTEDPTQANTWCLAADKVLCNIEFTQCRRLRAKADWMLPCPTDSIAGTATGLLSPLVDPNINKLPVNNQELKLAAKNVLCLTDNSFCWPLVQDSQPSSDNGFNHIKDFCLANQEGLHEAKDLAILSKECPGTNCVPLTTMPCVPMAEKDFLALGFPTVPPYYQDVFDPKCKHMPGRLPSVLGARDDEVDGSGDVANPGNQLPHGLPLHRQAPNDPLVVAARADEVGARGEDIEPKLCRDFMGNVCKFPGTECEFTPMDVSHLYHLPICPDAWPPVAMKV